MSDAAEVAETMPGMRIGYARVLTREQHADILTSDNN